MNDEVLQQLVDQEAIRSILIRFARYLDERDWLSYAALYSENGILETPRHRHVGRAGLAEMVAQDLGGYVATQHVSASHDIDVDGDRARARSSLLATHVRSEDGRDFWTAGGSYEVELQRDVSGWMLTLVRIHREWLFDTAR